MTQRRDLQALIDAAPVGKMQWRVIICCFLVVMLDGFDTAAIGFIAPDIRTHWQLTAGDLAPLFGAGLLGLTAGALLCGPLSDRFGRKRVIELCVFLFGALSLASAFSPDLQTLVFLRFLTGLGLGGAMPNTITITSEYLPARRRGALVTLMFCGFTLGSAFGGIVSAQLVPVIGWHGILVLGGVLPLMLFVALLVVLPESPRWQVRRQLPQAVIAKTVSAITRERYVDTHFYLIESASVTKGSIRQSVTHHVDAVGSVLYEPADYLPALKLDADAIEPSRHRPATRVLGHRRVPDWWYVRRAGAGCADG